MFSDLNAKLKQSSETEIKLGEEIRILKLENRALAQTIGEKFWVCFKGHGMELKFTPTARINRKGKQDKGERISCNICGK